MENNQIENIVIEEFSSNDIQETYREMTKHGLWKSEEILFKKYFKKNSTILDIGCGSGRTTYGLKKLDYEVIGIDITPEMIKSAKALSDYFNLNIDFRVSDAKKLNFKDNSFDNAVFSFNGWDQIPGKDNRLKVLKEAYRILKTGGHFIFTSHIRELNRKYAIFWIKQWVKHYILKPLGFKIIEKEFGDVFFKQFTNNNAVYTYNNLQYIHIPNLFEIINMIDIAGFNLKLNDFRNKIASEDSNLSSYNCMFFVCKKP